MEEKHLVCKCLDSTSLLRKNMKSSIRLRHPVQISTRHLGLEQTTGIHLYSYSLAHISTIQFSIWYEPLMNTRKYNTLS